MPSSTLQRRTALATIAAAALLAACAQTQPAPNAPVTSVTGMVSLREQADIPPDSVLVVELQDSARAGATAAVVSQQAVKMEGLKLPYRFTLPVEPSRLNPAAQYVVAARITRGNQPTYINEMSQPVLTGGAAARADLVLVRVAP